MAATEHSPHAALPKAIARPLQSLAHRLRRRGLVGGLSRLSVFVLGAWLLRFGLDYLFQLNFTVRLIFLLFDIGIGVWIVRKYLWPAVRHRPTLDESALKLQKQFPALGSQPIASVQLAHTLETTAASPLLIQRLLDDTARLLPNFDWRAAAPYTAIRRWIWAALLLILTAVTLVALAPYEMKTLGLRLALFPVAPLTKTQLTVEYSATAVERGGALEVNARTAGTLPTRADVEIEDDRGQVRKFPMLESDETGVFNLQVPNLHSEVRIRVLAGDAVSRWSTILVNDAPATETLAWSITPPAYTGLSATTLNEGPLRVPAGAHLGVSGEASLPLDSAAILIHSGDETASTSIETNARSFSGEAVLRDPNAESVSIRLRGKNGVASSDETRYPLEVIPDQSPVVELASTIKATDTLALGQNFSISGTAADDYGLTSLQLQWRIQRSNEIADSSAEGEIHSVRLPISTGNQKNAALETIFTTDGSGDGVDLAARRGDAVTWWIEAADNRPASDGPQLTRSAERTLRMVTPEEKMAEILKAIRSGLSEIDDVSRQQDAAGDRIGEILESAPELP